MQLFPPDGLCVHRIGSFCLLFHKNLTCFGFSNPKSETRTSRHHGTCHRCVLPYHSPKQHAHNSTIDVANVDDERTVNALEHIRVQLWLNVSHGARLSVTLAINHVDNTVVFHCLNIGNFTDGDSLASHATTNQEYIGRVQTLA